ncbi:branched-chain amino acid ABC transporter permease [Actinophytocola sp.]|uniref:branched-chain amino acid ABC transporter permease n=1 Tax=Actinophytocola sp. TaxID=1872138 RepID=UPI003D6A280A
MELLVGGVASGLVLGILYGLLGFGIVLLFKATGVANFAQGTFSMVLAFVAYQICVHLGVHIVVAFFISVVVAPVFGAAVYLLVIRPREGAGHLNLTIRTLALSMLLVAIVQQLYAANEPYRFPSLFPNETAFRLGSASITWLNVGSLGVAAILAAGFAWVFRATDLGLKLLALAERPEIARMLGINVRRLAVLSWMTASFVALVVGVLLAPTTLLSSRMADPYLLISFTAVVIGGLTSLPGALVGGVVVGLIDSITSLYWNADVSLFLIFVLFLLFLLFRPNGLFGVSVAERL